MCILILSLMLITELSLANSNRQLLYYDNFDRNVSANEMINNTLWKIEQQPGGRVFIDNHQLVIDDQNGCTVWFTRKLYAPVVISYKAVVTTRKRVSDLNCFWMATDPKRVNASNSDVISNGFGRHGKLEEYDTLRLYYVGYGGNSNSSTRFRKYMGDGTKPLLPEYDLRDGEYLLKPDHIYIIELVVDMNGTSYVRDGSVVFRYNDTDVLSEGWFGFRTVDSYIEISNFQVISID